MRSFYSLILAAFLLLAACNSAPSATPQEDAQGTEISRQVTAELSRRLTEEAAQPVSTSSPTEPAVPSPTAALPSATPLPTITPTEISTTTDTPVPDDPAVSLGSPDWTDSFDTAANWYLFEDDHTRVDLDDGSLVLTALHADGWSGWALSWPILSDFYLEATMSPGECAGLDRYGLVFRSPDADGAYLFGLSCDGSYSLRYWDGDLFTMLQNWTPSPVVKSGPGATNRLGVLAEENSISFYANGQFLGVVEDGSLDEGAFGLFVGSVNTEQFEVRADAIAYWDLFE